MRYYAALFLIFLFIYTDELHSMHQVSGYLNDKASGIVYHDINRNGIYDPVSDTPLPGVAVSNGREIAVTDYNGYYELPFRDDAALFVIKPRNWSFSVDENQLSRFYHMHSTNGISGTDYTGFPPSGAIPDVVNFPLYASDEPDNYKVVLFGDTQPRDEQEIYYIARDVLTELTGVKAAFGVTLGDIVFDRLDLFEPLIDGISTIGIPWKYVLGNHDIDFSGNNNTDARGAWYRVFGPSYHSFSYGPAHFIVLDNIRWIVEDDKRYYRIGLGEDQMEFLRNDLSRLESDQLLVVLTHIPYAGSTPWEDESERSTFFELLASHPRSVSFVAHTHRHYHHFLGDVENFPGDTPHHMVSVGTVCGSWWTGSPDEYGIPHAMMSDGTPTSYMFLHVDGNEWKLKFKAARRPAGFQMHIDVPEVADAAESANLKVTANIFNALPDAEVEIKIGENGQWVTMERNRRTDPVRVAVAAREEVLGDVPWRNLGNPQISEHIWEALPGIRLQPGAHMIHVRARDDWWEYTGNQLLYVR